MSNRHSQRLPALVWRLVCQLFTKRLFWIVLIITAIGCAYLVSVCRPPPLNVATFNIENYPKSTEQAAGALDLIGSLEADAVGVQEITRPTHFSKFVREYLGPQWTFLVADQPQVRHKVGLLFDDEVFDLIETHTHHETAVSRGARATLEVRLRTETGFAEQRVRIFVVHLKAGGTGGAIRRKQLRLLRPIVAEAVASGDKVVLLGDFNSTGAADRDELAALAKAAKLDWSSEALGCTSYWDRPQTCPGTALDHILGTGEARGVRAGGACETVGCESQQACPVYVKMVSDHCPVSATF
jgi:endonuclease/exonuclease/phosphatase family metal-dependent hydrolase